MVAKRPPLDIPWDACSDQPHRLRRPERRILRAHLSQEFLAQSAALARALVLLPGAGLQPHRDWHRPSPLTGDFCGLALALDHCGVDTTVALMNECGVRHLLLRIPAWQAHDLSPYLELLAALPQCHWVVCVMQDRAHVCDHRAWGRDLSAIVTACRSFTRWFQIGQAPNRLKWGCAHMGEYLDLMAVAEELRKNDPALRLVGPGILDFEPLALARCLATRRRLRFDAVGLGLYVDRRGGPDGRQYGCFDLPRKIQLLAALMQTSHRCARRLWISECNWPLAAADRWAPASPEYQVDEKTYAAYMLGYLRAAHATGLVERVYWWQPVARGYGLIDDRDLRRRPAWEAFCELLRNPFVAK